MFFVCLFCPRFGVHFAAGFHGECHWWRSDPCFQGHKLTGKGWPMGPAGSLFRTWQAGPPRYLGKNGERQGWVFVLCRFWLYDWFLLFFFILKLDRIPDRKLQSWPVHEAVVSHHLGYLIFFVICCMLEWLILKMLFLTVRCRKIGMAAKL